MAVQAIRDRKDLCNQSFTRSHAGTGPGFTDPEDSKNWQLRETFRFHSGPLVLFVFRHWHLHSPYSTYIILLHLIDNIIIICCCFDDLMRRRWIIVRCWGLHLLPFLYMRCCFVCHHSFTSARAARLAPLFFFMLLPHTPDIHSTHRTTSAYPIPYQNDQDNFMHLCVLFRTLHSFSSTC